MAVVMLGVLAAISATGCASTLPACEACDGLGTRWSADPDLLVDRGNVLILQNDLNAGQSSGGTFFSPDDDADGGTLRFEFFGAVELFGGL